MLDTRPALTSSHATKRHKGTVRMTAARVEDDASTHLRDRAAHILEQALSINAPSVRRTLLQRSFELLRQAQVAEVDVGLMRASG